MTIGSNVLLLLVAMGIDSPAVAVAPTPVNIDFTAPSGCSSLDSFYRGVLSRTDRVRLASPGEQGVQIRVRVTRVGSNIRGELRIGDQQEESETRRVDGISCNEVVEALSLTAALALDPSASLLADHNPAPEGAPLPASSTAPTAPVSSASIIDAREDAARRTAAHSKPPAGWGIDLTAEASAATYMTGALMLGPQVGLRVSMPTHSWTNLAAGAHVFHLSNELLGAADASSYRMTGIGVSVCPVYTELSVWLELGVCALARGAWLHASGLGVSHPLTVSRTWWALGVESLASLRLQEHWGLELAAGLATPLIVREFNSGTPAQDVGNTPIVGAQAGFGVAYRF